MLAMPRSVPSTWLRGRTRYCVWVIDLADPLHTSWRLKRRLAHWRQALAPWIRWGSRQPHITLQVCGFACDSPAPQWNDDFTPAMQAAQCTALERAAPGRLTLQIGTARSFASAAYLEVDDPDHALAALRDALVLPHDEFRNGPWVPHVTLGLYRRAWHRDRIMHALQSAQPLPCRPIQVMVRAISLVSYDAAYLCGRLHTVWRHVLAP